MNMETYSKTINGELVIKMRKNIIIQTKQTFVSTDTIEREVETAEGEFETVEEIVPSSKEITVDIYNPTHEQLLADGWQIYTRPEPTAEELLQRAKLRKKSEIKAFDKSSEVNEFFVSGVSLWLSKEDRTGLKLRFESELAMGKTTTTLWGNGVQFPLALVNEDGSVGLAFQMLYALEMYASACYDNTQLHLSIVDKLETIEEVESYDFKVGYPDKLNF